MTSLSSKISSSTASRQDFRAHKRCQRLAIALSKAKGGTRCHTLPSPIRGDHQTNTDGCAPSRKAPRMTKKHTTRSAPWVNIGAVGLRTEKARRLGDGGRPQPAKAYCQEQRRRKGWQQKPRWYPRVGYIHGLPSRPAHPQGGKELQHDRPHSVKCCTRLGAQTDSQKHCSGHPPPQGTAD